MVRMAVPDRQKPRRKRKEIVKEKKDKGGYKKRQQEKERTSGKQGVRKTEGTQRTEKTNRSRSVQKEVRNNIVLGSISFGWRIQLESWTSKVETRHPCGKPETNAMSRSVSGRPRRLYSVTRRAPEGA
ncbi:hypothetical protein NDU88_000983 [Pleurodeles waltl]|uniref:Uncharacterized protein n=1 Tax=Pleurodeles waltl TaxID=8319 RepID=A0AAV7USR8_PLEWA|nr:hypothetical protein NDU88_000983 [Pleurodeles waltl]